MRLYWDQVAGAIFAIGMIVAGAGAVTTGLIVSAAPRTPDPVAGAVQPYDTKDGYIVFLTEQDAALVEALGATLWSGVVLVPLGLVLVGSSLMKNRRPH